jgi:purine-binding chemotaxis protein CheW
MEKLVHQFATFEVNKRIFAIDVMKVQEILKPLPLTPIPLSESYIFGLMNLRGQLATSIGLRELFSLSPLKNNDSMNVVCRTKEGLLLSLVVDAVGDVLELSQDNFEKTPESISPAIKQFMAGVYKLPQTVVSVLDIDKLEKFLNYTKQDLISA